MAGTQAVPGTVVPTGAQIGPAGGYGAQGATGPTGPAGTSPIADSTQPGLMNTLSGKATDYVGGDNACHVFPPKLGGYLAYVSATQLSFLPFNGAGIQINGVIYTIPNSGVVGLANTNVYVEGVAGQSLVASTAYRVYCFNNGGVLTADFSTVAHATSATAGNVGVEIKSGDDSRTLLGIALMGGSATFIDQPQYRYTRSWVNRKRIAFNAISNGGSSTATTWFTALGAGFICFADEALEVHTSGWAKNSATYAGFVGNWLDGAILGMSTSFYNATVNGSCTVGLSWAQQMTTEVQHNLSSQVYVQGGTLTWYLNLTGSIG